MKDEAWDGAITGASADARAGCIIGAIVLPLLLLSFTPLRLRRRRLISASYCRFAATCQFSAAYCRFASSCQFRRVALGLLGRPLCNSGAIDGVGAGKRGSATTPPSLHIRAVDNFVVDIRASAADAGVDVAGDNDFTDVRVTVGDVGVKVVVSDVDQLYGGTWGSRNYFYVGAIAGAG